MRPIFAAIAAETLLPATRSPFRGGPFFIGKLGLSLTLTAGIFVPLQIAGAANTQDLYTGAAAGDVTVASNWNLGTVPTIANDVIFSVAGTPNFGSGPTPGPNLTVGSVNVTAPVTLTLRNDTSGSDPATVTLGGAGNLGNSVSGTAADLLYVASGATFNLNNTSATTRDREHRLGTER